jgi:hypothetical protein
MPVQMIEHWRGIPGWPDYEISDQGRARSKSRWVDGRLDANGRRSRRLVKGKLLKPVVRDSGIPCFNLWRGNDYRQFPVRRLVLLAFNRPGPRGADAVNVDGDLSNNRLGNLKWEPEVLEGCAQ